MAAHVTSTHELPPAWNTSLESLNALRTAQKSVPEGSFHEGTHVLYDLRTFLGQRPVKYLEIGTFTGISSILMLTHPLPTSITAVDPCVLHHSQYNGTLNQEETIRKNVDPFLPNGCDIRNFWKLNVGFSPEALPRNESFDIVFIDGDHSYDGVWADFNHTINLLRPGGFIVFDDYLDYLHSPEVQPAVDDIVRANSELIDVGTPRNTHGIYFSTRPEHKGFIGEYILQKPGNFGMMPLPEKLRISEPVLCITVNTHQRLDKRTPELLERMWKMLLLQSMQSWKLYLTGDHFEDETELTSLSFYGDSRVRIVNLESPGERGKMEGVHLWHNAGTVALNDAINRALGDDYEWIVRLDDDDIWDSDHLQNILNGVRTGATFVFTGAQFHDTLLPPEHFQLAHTAISHVILPKPCCVVQSSVALNMRWLSSRYTHSRTAADAEMWGRVVFDDLFYPAFVPVTSVHYLKKSDPLVVRKTTLKLMEVPSGWYDDSIDSKFEHLKLEYHTLATETFPANLSNFCQYVIGPATAPDIFHRVEPKDSPYHIRTVMAFDGLPVWRRLTA